MDPIRIASIVGSVLILVFIVHLIRRRRLRERYALLWLVLGGVLTLFAVWRELIDILARWFEVHYAPSLIFLAFAVLLSLITLHLTVVVSRLGERTRRLTQDLALLRARLEERESE